MQKLVINLIKKKQTSHFLLSKNFKNAESGQQPCCRRLSHEQALAAVDGQTEKEAHEAPNLGQEAEEGVDVHLLDDRLPRGEADELVGGVDEVGGAARRPGGEAFEAARRQQQGVGGGGGGGDAVSGA